MLLLNELMLGVIRNRAILTEIVSNLSSSQSRYNSRVYRLMINKFDKKRNVPGRNGSKIKTATTYILWNGNHNRIPIVSDQSRQHTFDSS